jgi:hypothetical protein
MAAADNMTIEEIVRQVLCEEHGGVIPRRWTAATRICSSTPRGDSQHGLLG